MSFLNVSTWLFMHVLLSHVKLVRSLVYSLYMYTWLSLWLKSERIMCYVSHHSCSLFTDTGVSTLIAALYTITLAGMFLFIRVAFW
jgi:hypothetical protein